MCGFFDKLGKGAGKAVKAFTGRFLVIQHDFRPGELVWEYPQRMIPYGSRIIVGPNQAALVIRSGKVLGVLRQGEWVLDTAHVPGLRGLMQELYEGVPLPVRIIFVNVTEKDLRFGGRANTRDGVPILFRGSVRVAVPEDEESIKRFVLRVAGEDKTLTTEELEASLRDYLVDRVESYLAAAMSIDVFINKAQVRSLIQAELSKLIAENWYLHVKTVAIDVDIPEEWLKKLQESGYMQMLALAATNPQVAEFMRNYDITRRFMDALAKSQGGQVASIFAFFPMLQQFMQQGQVPGFGQPGQQQRPPQQPPPPGAGAVAAAPQQPPVQQVQQPGLSQPRQAQPSGYKPRCPYCGAEIPETLRGAKFCPFCGKPIKWCPNGHVAPAEAKFCPVCGAKLG